MTDYTIQASKKGSSHNGIVTTDSTWSRGERVGGTEDGTAGLHGVTAFPDHSTDGTAAHVCVERVSRSHPVIRKVQHQIVGLRDVQAMRPGKKGLSERSS